MRGARGLEPRNTIIPWIKERSRRRARSSPLSLVPSSRKRIRQIAKESTGEFPGVGRRLCDLVTPLENN